MVADTIKFTVAVNAASSCPRIVSITKDMLAGTKYSGCWCSLAGVNIITKVSSLIIPANHRTRGQLVNVITTQSNSTPANK